MKKEEIIVSLSILLNRAETDKGKLSYFENKKHDELVEELRAYLLSNSMFFGMAQIESLQGLNDHGVDLLFSSPNNIKIGFQIKSHYDVTEKDFSKNVKRQIAESAFHGIEKLYILICSPYIYEGVKLEPKISNLLSEVSSYKSSYCYAFSPMSCIGLFLNNGSFNELEFNSIKKMYVYEEVNPKQIINEIAPQEDKLKLISRLSSRKATNFKDAAGFISFIQNKDFDINIQSFLMEVKSYCNLLEKIPFASREFFLVVLRYAAGYGELGSCINCIKASFLDILTEVKLSREELISRIRNMDRFKLIKFDADDPYENGVIVIELSQLTNVDDLNISFEIREFLNNDLEKLKSFYLDLDFALLD